MSTFRYCPSCGKQNPYVNSFCGSCGQSLNSFATKPKIVPQQNFSNPAPHNSPSTFTPFSPDAEDDDNDYNPWDNATHVNINLTQLEVETSIDNKRETIGNIINPQNFVVPKQKTPRKSKAKKDEK